MQKSFQLLTKQIVPKILCVGKNYLQHVKEMGGSEVPTQPVIFQKPWTSLSYNPTYLSLPIAKQHTIDHEVELGVYIGKSGSKIPKNQANEHIGGYFLAIDITDRDLQKIAKTKGLPWQLSKGQDNFCPVSPFVSNNIDPYNVELAIEVNGTIKQKDTTNHMHFKIDDIISYVSQYVKLNEGDLILTGTPQGVGPLKLGDKILATANIHGNIIASLNFEITV